MIPPLDVFSITTKVPVWLGAAESLVQALELAKKAGTGDYMVFSHQTGHKTTYTVEVNGTIRPNNGCVYAADFTSQGDG